MTALISVIPILLLIVLMMGFKVSGYRSAIVTLIVTVLLALFAVPAMGIIPEKYADASIIGITCWSVVEGVLKACFPIILIIICAIFSYNILCETKEIETIKTQFIQMTSDKGLLVLLLTWGLGGVLEGMAGFGTAVAIPAAILIGLGFKPMFSAVICLVANTVAVGFGAVGLPATTLANQVAASGTATPDELCEVATFIILQLSLMFYITPFLILMMTDKTKILKNITIALFVGTCSITVQFCCAHFIGPETPAILGSVAAIAAMLLYDKLFLRHEAEKDTVQVEHHQFGWMAVECRPDDFPWCRHRWTDSGHELQEADGASMQDHAQPAKDGGNHLLSGSYGHADEQYRHDQRHCQRTGITDRCSLPVLCTAHWLYWHLRHR